MPKLNSFILIIKFHPKRFRLKPKIPLPNSVSLSYLDTIEIIAYFDIKFNVVRLYANLKHKIDRIPTAG